MDVDSIEKLFSEYDPNGNGYITTDQLKNLVFRVTNKEITPEEHDILVQQLDKDKDGKISLQEFLVGIDNKVISVNDFLNQSGYRLPSSPEDYHKHLKFIFSLFDKDEDGMVDIDQLREMLSDIKTQSGVDESNDDDDDDVEYIIKFLCSNGDQKISFPQFMAAIEQINSPSTNSPILSHSSHFNSQYNGNTNNYDTDNTDDENNNSDYHSSSRPNSPLNENDNHQTTTDDEDGEENGEENQELKRKRRNRGRASSWVAPGSIVNMIKKRTDLFSKEEIEVFDSTESDQVEQYKHKADKLKSQNEHFVSKLNIFEGQLKEARETHEKLSEDNVRLKENIVIGKRTLIENQKLSSSNKKLEDDVEYFKQQISRAEDEKKEFIRSQNSLKSEREQLLSDISSKDLALNELETKYRKLEEQSQNAMPAIANTYLEQLPSLDELEQLKQENQQLKIDNRSESEKSENHINLLNEEFQLLKKQSKSDKALLESSNQIIHKLKVTLEDLQSTSHNSDPSYKLSLLSELEQEVVTRLGTPGTFDPNQSSPPNFKSFLATNPVSIKQPQGRERTESKKDSGSYSPKNDKFEIINEKLDKEIEKSKQYEEELHEKDQKIKELLNQIKDVEKEKDSVQSQNENLNNENSKLKFQYESLTKSVELPSKSIDPINIKAGQTQNEISLLMERIKNSSIGTSSSNLLVTKSLEDDEVSHTVSSPISTPISSPNQSIQDLDLLPPLSTSLSNDSHIVVEGLQKEIQSLNQVKQQLERDLKRYDILSQSSSTENLKNESLIDELKNDNQKVMEKFRNIEYENIITREENKDLKENIAKLQERIEIMKIEFETKYNQIQVPEKKTQLQREIDDLKSRLKKYESEDHQVDIIELESHKARLDDLNNKLMNEKNLNKHLQSQLDQLERNRNINSDTEPLLSGGKQQKEKRSCCIIC